MALKDLQPALTIEQQIANLKDIGLVIKDDKFAQSFLNEVSYFRFIKAFSLGLKPKNGNYNGNVTFEQLTELYLFNVNFRQLLFTQIERIEINLRCRVSNYFSVKYGALGYKDSANFINEKYHADFLKEIEQEVKRNKRLPFIYNFKSNYVDIPFYALIEVFSFGSLSKFFKNMLSVDKKNIALIYGVEYTYFESWIESIAYVRNICAHYGRLYNVKLTKKPKLYKQYKQNHISNMLIFGVICCMKNIILNDIHWSNFVNKLDNLFKEYPLTKKELMGFPNNWKTLLVN